MATDLALRLRACERVRDAVAVLAALGPVSQLVDRCAAAAAEAADLDRVLLSRVEDGALVAERLHVRAGGGGVDPGVAGADDRLARLRRSAPRLAYPLVECELVRRRRARLVADVDPSQPGRFAFLEVMRWPAYVAAPVIVDGDAVGFLHGDRGPDRRPLGELDVETLEHFAAGFAIVYERAVLRDRLRHQQREVRRIATWAEAVTAELSDATIGLAPDPGAAEQARAAPAPPTEPELSARITPRELDVLRLIAEGRTNGEIARALFVSEGTVKFHVKNILRKMQAHNRADAGARYLRVTLRERAGASPPPAR